MDEIWPPETDGEEATVSWAGISRSEHIWVDGVRISPHDCPDCLKWEEFDCHQCAFFAPETCHLLRDPFLILDTRTFFVLYRQRFEAQRAAQRKRQQKLIRAIISELRAHGRPLHYTVLARMVADRHAGLQVSERSVLLIMAHHPKVFEKVAEGVYRCGKANKRRR